MAEQNSGTPAVVEGLAQLLQQEAGEPVNNIILGNLVSRGNEAYRELPADRYRVKGPVFTGNEDVEQFIQKFSDVVEVTQWPPRVDLLKLGLALAEKAKPYGLGPNFNSIFAALRIRFGISPINARVYLQGLQHDPRTSARTCRHG